MAKKKAASRTKASSSSNASSEDVLRLNAEQQFAHELDALADQDDREKPPGWRLSPWAVKT